MLATGRWGSASDMTAPHLPRGASLVASAPGCGTVGAASTGPVEIRGCVRPRTVSGH